jgi:hypothetical protein
MTTEALKKDKALVKLLIKELSSQLNAEDKGYEAFAVRLVGGEKPSRFSLDVPEVLLEPIFLPVIFIRHHLTPLDVESDWGVQGPMLLSLRDALRHHYAPANDWVEEKISALVRYATLLARAYLLDTATLDAAPEAWYHTNKVLMDEMTKILDHMDWNRVRQTYGKKEGHRFALQIKTRSESFPRRNRGAMAGARRGGGPTSLANIPDDDLSDTGVDGTPPAETPAATGAKATARKRRRY